MSPTLLATVLVSCADKPIIDPDLNPPAGNGNVTLAVQTVVQGLSSPVFLTTPAGDQRLFVVEQAGRIRLIKSGALVATPFLDMTAKVLSGGERGLLSVAFHPSYASNGYFYVYYTDGSGNLQIERYHVSSNADLADAASAKTILSIPHSTFPNHNGGLLRFGPDGMLYAGIGDGGSGGDPNNNGQNNNTLLGKLLRLDVDHGDPYAIPSGNPFASSGRGEIWAYGLRNPWRYAFDPPSGNLYIADVGQNQYEEVNVTSRTTPGVNYGWRLMEGNHCYNPSSGCNQSGLLLPVLEYSHADGSCSITGGSVYRGAAIPEIVGHYFYSDYCTGWLKSFVYSGGQATSQNTWSVGNVGNVLSFGEDAAGELYILSGNGRVYRIVKQ